jgi:ubiquinone/menaquinone biosynthesis C-methylase UbiE
MDETRDNRRPWNRFAGIYDLVIKKDAAAYAQMYELVSEDLRADMNVLELATGTGLIALNVARFVLRIEATDFSPEMIARAKKKPAPANVSFAVSDATNLPYGAESFDAVIISNALHVMPKPELALENIRRVLKPDGVLIAPTFSHKGGNKQTALSAVLRIAGVPVRSAWTPDEYLNFLRRNGFETSRHRIIPAMFPLVYVAARVHKK